MPKSLEVGTWRDLETGVDPGWLNPEEVDGAFDNPGTPPEPIHTRIEGPWRIPWYDGLEDPFYPTNLPLLSSPNPTYPVEDIGAEPIVGAYDGAYRTLGPVGAWGHEPSGGLGGDQAIGRIMRFPANIPSRYDQNGVFQGDYRDELIATLDYGNPPIVSDAEVTTSLTQWPNVWQY